MLNTPADWDLVAGEYHFNSKKDKRAAGIPSNYILTYLLDSNLFRKICDGYPAFRSFIVTRSLVRRSVFTKNFLDNKQAILLKRKLREHRVLVQDMKNDYIFIKERDSDDEDNSTPQKHETLTNKTNRRRKLSKVVISSGFQKL